MLFFTKKHFTQCFQLYAVVSSIHRQFHFIYHKGFLALSISPLFSSDIGEFVTCQTTFAQFKFSGNLAKKCNLLPSFK
jgi:hypothetical protein